MSDIMRKVTVYPVHTGKPLCPHGRIMVVDYLQQLDVGAWIPLADIDEMTQVIERITRMVVIEARQCDEAWQWFILVPDPRRQ